MAEQADIATKDRIAELVRRLLAKQGLDRPVGDDDDLAERGLSSADLVSLMLSVEEEFRIAIPESEMRPTHFRSIAGIEALVQALQGVSSAG